MGRFVKGFGSSSMMLIVVFNHAANCKITIAGVLALSQLSNDYHRIQTGLKDASTVSST